MLTGSCPSINARHSGYQHGTGTCESRGGQTRLSEVDQLRNILRRLNDSLRSWPWSTIGDG